MQYDWFDLGNAMCKSRRHYGNEQNYLRAVCDVLGFEAHKITELGVYKGQGAARWEENFPDAKLTLVDAWRGLRDTGPMMKANDEASWDAMFNDVHRKFGRRHSIIRGITWEVAEKAQNCSQDIVYVDADHSAVGCGNDIRAWLPKVRTGRLICGHNYGKSVKAAVQAHFGDRHIAGPHRVWWAVREV